jgi:hypothetical protein
MHVNWHSSPENDFTICKANIKTIKDFQFYFFIYSLICELGIQPGAFGQLFLFLGICAKKIFQIAIKWQRKRGEGNTGHHF